MADDASLGPPIDPSARALYVSTAMDTWETDSPGIYAQDVTVDGVAYRRLDSAYYAWLRAMVDRAIEAYDRGKMEEEPFKRLIDRFAPVYAWALRAFGIEALEAAMPVGRASAYRPPAVWDPVAFSADSLADESVDNS